MVEWEWLSDLKILYHELYIETMKLVTIFRSSGDKKVWAEKTKPALKEMQNVIDEMISHMKKHQAPQQA
jgi:uncharacterized phage-like protein YoqJ